MVVRKMQYPLLLKNASVAAVVEADAVRRTGVSSSKVVPSTLKMQ